MPTRKAPIIIQKPGEELSVLMPTTLAAMPLLRMEGADKGSETVMCGTLGCDVTIAKDLKPGMVTDIYVICPKCHGMNEINV